MRVTDLILGWSGATPARTSPKGVGNLSNMSTATAMSSRLCRCSAEEKPAGPEPTMATRRGFSWVPGALIERGRVGNEVGELGQAGMADGGGAVERVERVGDGHRHAGEDRRVAQRVGARLGWAEFLNQVQELADVVGLEGDDELLIVEAERVGGVDGDLRIPAADGDVLVHDPLALGHVEPIPLAFLVERVDDEVLAT